MSPDQGMLDLDFHRLGIFVFQAVFAFVFFTRCARIISDAGRMNRDKPVQKLFHPVGQRVISRLHAGPERIAAHRRNIDTIEHGDHSRLFKESVIRMPAGAEGCALACRFQNLDQFGMRV